VELDRLYPNRDQDPQEQTDFENDCSLLTQPFVAVLLLQTLLARLRRARAEAQLQLDAATPLARRYIAIVSDLERQKDSVTARTDELIGKRRYGPTLDPPPGVTLEQLNTLEGEVQALLEDYRRQLDQLRRVAITIHREEIKIETDLDFVISGGLRIIYIQRFFPVVPGCIPLPDHSIDVLCGRRQLISNKTARSGHQASESVDRFP
jgi:hypothetical protein